MPAYSLDPVDLAQEARLLRDMLEALGGAESLHDVLRVVGHGIKNVVPYRRWQTISIALKRSAQPTLDVYRVDGQLANAYWSNVGKGAYTAARELGAELTFEAAASDATFQNQAIDAAIARGVDGIAIAPIDPQASEPAIARARAAGIPVVTLDTPPVDGSAALLYIGTDNVAAGRRAGEALARLLPAGGPVGVLTYYLQAGNSRERIAGFIDGMDGNGAHVLPPGDVQGVDEHGEVPALAILEAHPDLAGAFGVCAMNGPGWAAAARAAGRQGQLKIVGFDMGPDAIELLRNGEIHAVIAQREGEMGSRCVEILCRILVEGEQTTVRRYGPSGRVDTGVDVVSLQGGDWSVALADYLMSGGADEVDHELRAALASRPRPPRLVLIGMATSSEAGLAVEQIGRNGDPLFARVLAEGRAAILEMPGRLRVGVPLRGRGGEALGVLGFESATSTSCPPAELARFDRMARSAALLIENSALIGVLDERSRELSEANQRQELLLATVRELSSPVVPITRGVLVLPVVGSVDTHRAREFTATLLEAIERQQASIVLVDITGVPIIDTAVAAGFVNAARAAQLLGAEVVFVGITPPVAQTLVSLGIDFGRATTHADLQSGFAYALTRTGGSIVYR